jgi:hypothetical protein
MGIAARTVHLGAFDITDVATFVSLGDVSANCICTHIVQVTGTWTGTLIFQGTLGSTSGTYVTIGYTTPADPSTVTTAGTFTANGVFRVIADGFTDVRIKVSIAGTGTPVINDRPIVG